MSEPHRSRAHDNEPSSSGDAGAPSSSSVVQGGSPAQDESHEGSPEDDALSAVWISDQEEVETVFGAPDDAPSAVSTSVPGREVAGQRQWSPHGRQRPRVHRRLPAPCDCNCQETSHRDLGPRGPWVKPAALCVGTARSMEAMAATIELMWGEVSMGLSCVNIAVLSACSSCSGVITTMSRGYPGICLSDSRTYSE